MCSANEDDRIESMKMETVIRSPQKGVVAKLVHKEGVCFSSFFHFCIFSVLHMVANIV